MDFGVRGLALFRSRIRRGIHYCVNHRGRILSPTHDCMQRKPRTGTQMTKKEGSNSKFGLSFAGWFLNGERENMRRLMQLWIEIWWLKRL
jgi:hypothetical protein